MKKYLLIVFIAALAACSGGTTKKTIYDMTENERTDLVRKNVMAYCQEKGGDVIFNYFQAFNREYTNREKPENGAFEKVNVLLDSTEFKDFKLQNYGKKKAPFAEVSLMLNATHGKYSKDEKMGNIGIITGIDFYIDSMGNVLSHKGYTEFEKGFIYYVDTDKFKLSDLFLGF